MLDELNTKMWVSDLKTACGRRCVLEKGQNIPKIFTIFLNLCLIATEPISDFEVWDLDFWISTSSSARYTLLWTNFEITKFLPKFSVYRIVFYPKTATTNWIIREGISKTSSIAFAYFKGTRMDSGIDLLIFLENQQ